MSNKTKQDHKVQIKPQNIGTIDRFFRAFIGFSLLSSVFVASRTTETFLGFTTDNFPYFLVSIIAFYPSLTAILGWDPILQLLHKRSETRLGGDVSGTISEQIDAVSHASERERREAEMH